MAVVLGRQQLPRLLSTLQNIRKANHIRGEIISKLQSVITDYDFIVDRWPDYSALVVRVNPPTAKYRNHLILETIVHATDCDALESLVQLPEIIDWSARIGFAGIYPNELPSVLSVMQKHHRPYHLDKFFDMKVTEKTLKIRPIPNGFKIGSLIPEQAHLVNSMWSYNGGTHSELYIKELIRKLPSCCLYNREGSLVGYALTYHYGYQGVLHILEAHRGKGYAKMIMSHLAGLHLQTMEEVHIHVHETNKASIALNKQIGFETNLPEDTSWWINTPASE
ncbi:glycine N-acyltransferase-like [Haliotis cracherodii]|uniref:glycine N-acyltransferase-like n=1 Tax=Haliotis cracherodii TaxID=6455 RepID=UPI0039E83EEF